MSYGKTDLEADPGMHVVLSLSPLDVSNRCGCVLGGSCFCSLEGGQTQGVKFGILPNFMYSLSRANTLDPPPHHRQQWFTQSVFARTETHVWTNFLHFCPVWPCVLRFAVGQLALTTSMYYNIPGVITCDKWVNTYLHTCITVMISSVHRDCIVPGVYKQKIILWCRNFKATLTAFHTNQHFQTHDRIFPASSFCSFLASFPGLLQPSRSTYSRHEERKAPFSHPSPRCPTLIQYNHG